MKIVQIATVVVPQREGFLGEPLLYALCDDGRIFSADATGNPLTWTEEDGPEEDHAEVARGGAGDVTP